MKTKSTQYRRMMLIAQAKGMSASEAAKWLKDKR